MEKIIFDCDNTMGLSDRDVDDGLTLLYILGDKKIDLRLLTTTFGNDNIDVVNNNTEELLRKLGREDINIKYGTALLMNPNLNEAAKEIVSILNNEDDITIIATGSLHNLGDAERIQRGILKKAKQIILMGGIEEDPFIVDGVKLNELNFSCDYEASKIVFESEANVVIATANMCLNIRFSTNEHNRLNEDKEIYKFIRENAKGWFNKFYNDYKSNDVVIWDLNCALYLSHEDLFKTRDTYIATKEENLKIGLLEEVVLGNDYRITQSDMDKKVIEKDKSKYYKVKYLVDVLDKNKFNNELFKAWDNVEINENKCN